MTTFQMGLTIAVCTAATMLTRFLPFLIFSSKDHCLLYTSDAADE